VKGEELDRLKKAVQSEDGIVATHLNSKISIRMVRYLAKTAITPVQVSIVSFLISIVAGFCFSFGIYFYTVVGAVLLQLSFILDMCDGELARYKNKCSKFGAWLDKVFDRLSEFSIFCGICVGVYRYSHNPRIWILGLATIFTLSLLNYSSDILGSLSSTGKLLRSNSAEKINKFLRIKKFIKPGYLSFGRDIQMFLIFLGCIFNQIVPLFWTIIILGNAHWLVRAFIYWRPLKEEAEG